MSTSTEGPHTRGVVSDREAGRLLLAFLGAVIVVLAVATQFTAPIVGTSTPTESPRTDIVSTSTHGTPGSASLERTPR